MKISRKEALRYMGIKSGSADENTELLLDQCIREIESCKSFRYTYRRFPVVIEGEIVYVGDMKIKSHSLARNLKDCEEVLLFAATLGLDIDRMLNRYIKLNISKAVVFQAAAGAAIESYCNEIQKEIESILVEEGLYVRPRFSPGYGDVSLDVQRDFLHLIASERTVGITLTEGNLMVPEKSVSAFMGLSRIQTYCRHDGCEDCAKKDCLYRR